MSESISVQRPSSLVGGPWSGTRFSIIRPLFSIFGRTYRVYSETGQLVLFVRHPLFRMRSEFTLFADEGETQPLLIVKSRRLLAINMEHDVFFAATGQRLASLRTRGFSFLVRDAWDILDDSDRVAGEMTEEGSYLLRRMIRLIPGHHAIRIGGEETAQLTQRFRIFTKEFDLTLGGSRSIDPRFLVAASILAIMSDVRREEA
jgi:hypothetical protein